MANRTSHCSLRSFAHIVVQESFRPTKDYPGRQQHQRDRAGVSIGADQSEHPVLKLGETRRDRARVVLGFEEARIPVRHLQAQHTSALWSAA